MDGTSSKLKLTGRGNRNKATWVVEQLKKLQKKVVALIKGELQERLGVPPVALYLKTILDVRTMPFIRTIESQDADTGEASKAKMKTQAVVAVDWVAKNVMKHLDPAVTKPEVVRYYKLVASKWDEFEDLDKETGKRKFNIARLFEYITENEKPGARMASVADMILYTLAFAFIWLLRGGAARACDEPDKDKHAHQPWGRRWGDRGEAHVSLPLLPEE